MTASGAFRILLLGSNYNPLSVACASALAALPGVALSIGLDGAVAGSLWRAAKRSFVQSGASFTVRRAADMVRARAQLALRPLGLTGVPRSLEGIALDRDLPDVFPVLLRGTESIDRIDRLDPDLIVVAAFSQIIRAPMLERPRLGIVNVHPSLLPKYRGPNPHYWVMANGERETGVTVHHLDEGIDTGDIIMQQAIAIMPGDSERTLQRRTAALAADLLPAVINGLAQGRAPRRAQVHEEATYFPNPPRGASRL